MDTIVIETMTLIEEPSKEELRRLDMAPGDELTGDVYTFTASGSGNSGIAFIGGGFIATEWGGDPQWFMIDLAHAATPDRWLLAAALNGDLPDA